MPTEIRGARDLVELWRDLPLGMLAYPRASGPPDLGLAVLSDTLRARAWREHCTAAEVQSCAERGQNCRHPQHCRADALFPVALGGGAPSWRMASLFIHDRPRLEQQHLIALGATACDALGWAARVLRDHHGLCQTQPLPVTRLAEVELSGARHWQLNLVTPWLVSKGRAADDHQPPEVKTLAHELRKAMRLRAHKLTALCLHDPRAQRLAAHLAHHVAEALLPQAVQVEQAEIHPEPLALASRGNGARFTATTWTGWARLRVEPDAWPWLTLIALCGGGENADKGFGGIEVQPLD